MDSAAVTRDILRQAAEWAALLDGDAGAATRARCEAWCRQDPRHRLVLERMRTLDGRLESLDAAQRQVLRSAAAPARRLRRGTVLALLAVSVALVMLVTTQHGSSGQQQTARAERRTLMLPDRSTLLLDADTALSSRLERDMRRVELHRGRLLATVTPDTRRPFTVITADATATALGTAYIVDVSPGGTRVTVVESTVRVCTATGGMCRDLGAGSTVRVAEGRLGITQAVDVTAAQAWTRGWLEADDLPAVEALQALARHLPTPLRFDAATLRDVRVTGSYPLDRPRDALRALEATAGLAIEEGTGGEMRIVRR